MKKTLFTLFALVVLSTLAFGQQTDIRVNGTTKMRLKPDSMKSYVPHYFDGGVSGPLATNNGPVTLWNTTLSGGIMADSGVIQLHSPNKLKTWTFITQNGIGGTSYFPAYPGGYMAMSDAATNADGAVPYYVSEKLHALAIGAENYVLKVSGGVPAWRPDSVGTGGGGGITTLNTLTAGTQTFATGTAGTDFAISSTTSTHTFNIPSSSAANRGLLTSADWSTFNGKQAAITGGATTITSSNLTASRALVSDASGKVAAATTTSTEIGYVNGVTSGIQTQINGKASTGTTLTMTGTANQVSVTNSGVAQDLSANRSWTLSLPQNIHTGATPQFAGVQFGTDVANSPIIQSSDVNDFGFGSRDFQSVGDTIAMDFGGWFMTLYGQVLSGNRSIAFPTASGTFAVSATSPLSLSATTGALTLSTVPVASGGTGATTLTGLLQGNGTSAVTAISNSSTTGQTLRVTGASTYGWGALDLANASAVTGILPGGNGGTGNGFTSFTGPTTSLKTFTLPNASATVLTTNAAVTVAQGGTGVATITGLMQGNGTSNVTGIANSSTTGQTLRVTGASTYAWGALDLANSSAVTGTLPGGNGGTGNAFFSVSGPATSLKTYTLPNTNATILTDARKDTMVKAYAFYNVSAADSGLLLEVPAGAASWTVRDIRAVRVGGTAATINVRNVTDAVGIIDNYATTTSIATADATINNPTLSAGDLLRVELISITGTVQEIFIQMIIERPL